jgi:hypothetical protein
LSISILQRAREPKGRRKYGDGLDETDTRKRWVDRGKWDRKKEEL